jgi:hypothetical protein
MNKQDMAKRHFFYWVGGDGFSHNNATDWKTWAIVTNICAIQIEMENKAKQMH